MIYMGFTVSLRPPGAAVAAPNLPSAATAAA